METNKILKEKLMNLWLETFQTGLGPDQVQARIDFLVDSMRNPNSLDITGNGKCQLQLHQLIYICDETKNIHDNYMVYKIEQRSKDYRVTFIKYSYYEELIKLH